MLFEILIVFNTYMKMKALLRNHRSFGSFLTSFSGLYF